MKKHAVAAIISGVFAQSVAIPTLASADDFYIESSSFRAPTVTGASSIANPHVGDIVYDQTVGGFYGYAQTGSWALLASAFTTPRTPTMQKFISGSGTYTTPTSPAPIYLRIRMIGGGGGGAGASGSTTSCTSGGNTTFGSSLLVANGGACGTTTGGGGGTASLGTGPLGIALQGASGVSSPVTINSSSGGAGGGAGASTPFAGGAAGAPYGGSAGSAIANTGTGGGGAPGTSSDTSGGAGGGAGGYVDTIINSPSATYSYSVGVGGSPAASAGYGGSGLIIVEEHYQ